MTANPYQSVDIGVNLTNKSLMQDLPSVLQRASDAGVTRLVVTGTSLEESEKAIQLCQQYPQQLVCTTGVHPHHASDWTSDYSDQISRLASQPCVRAIGETGLDFNRNYSPSNAQTSVFRQQLDIAVALQKPVFCHQRDAHDAFLSILKEYREDLTQVVVHCFTDTKIALLDYLDLDCHIGITGWICDERRGTELQAMVNLIPSDRLMVETDSPYLLPRNLTPKPKSRINEPCYLPHILQTIAYHQNKSIQETAAECLTTSQSFFGLGD
ncbi:MAG: TatD DNase family protein [Gammaproteobacteria bacterium]|jgi:TatD DNase family protein